METINELTDIFMRAVIEIPGNDTIGFIIRTTLINQWNKAVDFINEHYDITYKKDGEIES